MIYADDDCIKLDGVVLPGLLKSLEVKQDALIDEQEVEGSSKKPKQATGYEDATVTLEISLQDGESQTRHQKLAIWQSYFKSFGQDKPVIHKLVSTHASLRGVTNVLLKSMSSKESNKREEITVSVELMEYVAITINATKVNQRAAASSTASDVTASSTTPSMMSEEYKKYMASNRGTAPKQTNKTATSPATDSARYRVNKNNKPGGKG